MFLNGLLITSTETNMILTIKVEMCDIVGAVSDRSHCPIARAVKRMFPSLPIAVLHIGGEHTSVKLLIGPEPVELTGIPKDFVIRFDRGERVSPFEFKIVFLPSVRRVPKQIGE
jgi:hypothetical protein